MGRAGGYPQERRDVTVVVEQGMELDGALGPSELRPREDAEAQIDHTGVEGVELVSETKTVFRSLDRALLIESDEQGLVDLVWTSLIGVGECGAANLGCAQTVIEERLLGLQGENEIAQAGLAAELRVDQAGELAPAREGADAVFAPMLAGELFELPPRNHA